MAAPRGKRGAVVTGVAGILALVVAMVAVKDRLRQEWHLGRLSSEVEEVRFRAADALVALRSTRGAAEMIRILKEGWRPLVVTAHSDGEQTVYLLDPLGYGLFHLGSAAPGILYRARDELPQLGGIIDLVEHIHDRRFSVVAIGSPGIAPPFSLARPRR